MRDIWIVKTSTKEYEYTSYERMSDKVADLVRLCKPGTVTVNGQIVERWGNTWIWKRKWASHV